jgi:hypothetical protein
VPSTSGVGQQPSVDADITSAGSSRPPTALNEGDEATRTDAHAHELAATPSVIGAPTEPQLPGDSGGGDTPKDAGGFTKPAEIDAAEQSDIAGQDRAIAESASTQLSSKGTPSIPEVQARSTLDESETATEHLKPPATDRDASVTNDEQRQHSSPGHERQAPPVVAQTQSATNWQEPDVGNAEAARGGRKRRIVTRWPVGVLIATVVASIIAGTLVLVIYGSSAKRTVVHGGSATQTAPAGAPSPPGPDAVTASMLAKAAAAIARAREMARATGDPRSPLANRAQAAKTLAGVYNSEIKKLSSMTVPGRYRARVRRFVTALEDDSLGLESYATSEQNNQVASCRSVEPLIQNAERALKASVSNLRPALILIPPIQSLGTAC